MAARSAGGNDQFLEGQQRTFNGVQFAGKENVVFQVLLDGFRDSLGLLVDLPPHCVRKVVWVGSKSLRSHVWLRRE